VVKDLANLLRWRLRDFKIKLRKKDLILKNEDYINFNGILLINDLDIEYEIEINYDYQRSLSNKYKEKKIIGTGKYIFPNKKIIKAN
jgi:hypothetical protein